MIAGMLSTMPGSRAWRRVLLRVALRGSPKVILRAVLRVVPKVYLRDAPKATPKVVLRVALKDVPRERRPESCPSHKGARCRSRPENDI